MNTGVFCNNNNKKKLKDGEEQFAEYDIKKSVSSRMADCIFKGSLAQQHKIQTHSHGEKASIL